MNDHNINPDKKIQEEKQTFSPKEKEKFLQYQIDNISETVVKELNKKHAFIGGLDGIFITERQNTDSQSSNKLDFLVHNRTFIKERYENTEMWVPRITPKDRIKIKANLIEGKEDIKLEDLTEGKWKTKADIWLKHPKRRTYEKIDFNPQHKGHYEVKWFENPVYNMYKGFAVEPKEGNCDIFLNYISTVICNHRKELCDFIIKLYAHRLQKPDKHTPSIVLWGSQGTGKSFFMDTLGSFQGDYYKIIDQPEALTGRFSGDLMNTTHIHADEAALGASHYDFGRVKSMITQKKLRIEMKGKDAIYLDNYIHIDFSSNSANPIPLDPGDRRFVILNVTNAHRRDFVFFNGLQKFLDNGGREHLLHHFLNIDLKGFNVWDKPQTEEGFELTIGTGNSAIVYIYRMLDEGVNTRGDLLNPDSSLKWEDAPTRKSVFAEYSRWGKENEEKVLTERRFASTLKQHLQVKDCQRRMGNQSVRCWNFTSLECARRMFKESFNNKDLWKKAPIQGDILKEPAPF